MQSEERISVWTTSVIAVATLLLVAPLSAEVFIDYDPEALNNDYKTFAWRTTSETSLEKSNPLAHSRIKHGIEHYLTLDGTLIESSDDADVYVTYHTSSEEELELDTTGWGYGFSSRWRWGGYYGRYGMPATTTTTVRSYTRGTIVIDLWDAETEELVWRGTITARASDNPEKAEKRFDKELAKLVKKWQKMKAKL